MKDACSWASDQVMITSEGGIAVRMTNGTGAASVKGTILEPSEAADNAVAIAAAGAYDAIGVMYSEGAADGAQCWVVVAGRVQVLLKDSTASARGNWIQVSDTQGRANAANAVPSPPTDAQHFQEIGHCIETKEAGTDVLAFAIIHFN